MLDSIARVRELPDEWDAMASDYYQKRQFLAHCEEENPCQQRYYILSSDGAAIAGAIVYTLRLDLLTFLGINSPVTMQIVGVPCSVPAGGLVGDSAFFTMLLRSLLEREEGLIVCLNLDAVPAPVPLSVGRTWPDIEFHNRFSRWDHYLSSLRSSYRRRLTQIIQDARIYVLQTGSCHAFNNEMYGMYLEVFKRSKGKLERLTLDFFRRLPDSFCLTTYATAGTLCGWTITHHDGGRLSFFLGGQSYAQEPTRLYLVQLMTILKQGIDAGAKVIDLGQSADVPKMRMGGVPREKVMLASHSSPLIAAALRAGINILSYRHRFPPTHVFRNGDV